MDKARGDIEGWYDKLFTLADQLKVSFEQFLNLIKFNTKQICKILTFKNYKGHGSHF